LKLGLSLPVFSDDAQGVVAFARRAAELGFDGVFSADHLSPPTGPSRPSLEPFTMLGAVAASVPGLYVGTLVARVTLRPPGMLAKQAAALDDLSGGRMILGLGTGDSISASEHRMFGVPLLQVRERRELLGETVEALRALFGGRQWKGGSHVPAMSGPLLPPGEPALWIGGTSESTTRLAGRLADGWNGWALDARGFRQRASWLAEAAGGREVMPTWGGITLVAEDASELRGLIRRRVDRGLSVGEVWTGTSDQLIEFRDDLAEARCGWMIFLVAGPADRMELIIQTLRNS
jgi:alkanesulfonate monooxygenase SsuD/methylene tetrahydromethanopterin reductase-like flavin-dependent oxidoreductase (luciferase family)